MIKFGLPGVPQKCLPGQMYGQAISLCHVCMKILSFNGKIDTIRDMVARKIDVVIPFKQAISYDQPDIVPAPGNPGVWVMNVPNPMVTGVPNALGYTVLESQLLEPSDIAPFGIFTRADSGTYQVGTSPLGGHDPSLNYVHIPEDAQNFINVILSKGIPPSFMPRLGECPP
jgi:hypothetical protein